MGRRLVHGLAPEPLRWIGVTLIRREMARADRNDDERVIPLGLLDRLNPGFAR